MIILDMCIHSYLQGGSSSQNSTSVISPYIELKSSGLRMKNISPPRNAWTQESFSFFQFKANSFHQVASLDTMLIHSCTNILDKVFTAATYGDKYLKGAFSITTLTMIKALLIMQTWSRFRTTSCFLKMLPEKF